jgi:hypothetical protein
MKRGGGTDVKDLELALLGRRHQGGKQEQLSRSSRVQMMKIKKYEI